MNCGWPFPVGSATCPVLGDWPVRSKTTGEIVDRCLNHAQRDVLGGQWEYVLWHAGVPISRSDDRRISEDGP